ncbi:MAG: LegC family aminotransferase [Ignavibacteriaceae bacterium]
MTNKDSQISNHIPLSIPSIQGNEWKYVKECLDEGWVSSAGKYVEKFESDIAKFVGVKNAIACVNGTSALHISLVIAGVEANDEVIVPTVTFIAPVNAVKYSGAEPVFMDCDNYYNLNVEKTIDFINSETIFKNGFSYNRHSGKRISAVIPVHIFGNAVNLDGLYEICLEKNIKIVEDATESLGTRYTKGKFSGKHTGLIGSVGCLSFNGNKIITTGGGGMILTNNDELAVKAKYLTTQAKDDEVRYIHGEVGYNYRLTNIQAALGVAQLEKLSEFLKIKKENYRLYKKEIENIRGLEIADVPDYADNNLWMYALRIDKDRYGMGREGLMEYLYKNKIQSRPVWYLNHLQKMYKNNQNYRIEKAYELYDITLNIPCSVNLTNEQLKFVIKKLENSR